MHPQRMGEPNDSGVNDEPLHIGVFGKVLVHSLKDIFIAPASESFIDTVPIAVLVR